MTDRITQLERLTRLRADRALSEEEFEREKRRLLEARPRQIWLFAIPALAAAAIVAALILPLLLREPAPQAAADAQPKAAAPVATSTPNPPRPTGPEPLDISSRISIAGGNCHFAPDLQRAFDRMFVRPNEGESVRVDAIQIGEMRVIPTISSERDEGVLLPNYRRYTAQVRFNTPVQWNGLRLVGLQTVDGWEFSSRSMEFSDSPARIRSTLLRIGIRLPAAPAYRTLPTEGCASSIGMERRANGGALVCASWC